MSFETPSAFGYTLYTKTGCNYCEKAKMLLNDEENLKIINCDNYDKELFLDFIKIQAKREHRTFPMIFNNNNFIGGYSDLLVYLQDILSRNDN